MFRNINNIWLIDLPTRVILIIMSRKKLVDLQPLTLTTNLFVLYVTAPVAGFDTG